MIDWNDAWLETFLGASMGFCRFVALFWLHCLWLSVASITMSVSVRVDGGNYLIYSVQKMGNCMY